jgi:hypothetical protein
LRIIHHGQEAGDLRPVRLRNLAGGEGLLDVRPAAREETDQRPVYRIAGIDLGPRISGAQVGIAGRMIEVPVGVDDRRHGPAALAGISEQQIAMLGMAARIDEDQPLRRVEEDAVAVRPAVGDHAARDQVERLARSWLRRRAG